MRTIPNFISQLEYGTPSSKQITLKSVYKTGKHTVQPVPDGRGWYMGIPKLSADDKKNLLYWAEPNSKFTIEDGFTFDLSNESDKITWDWVKHCNEIAFDLESVQSTKGAYFYVHIVEDEAAKSVDSAMIGFKALKYIFEDDKSNLVDRATILGVDMHGDSEKVIIEYLVTQAKLTPQKVVDAYENQFINLKLLLLQALGKQVIKYDGNIYRFGSTVLGVTEDAAFDYLKRPDNKAIVALIERQTHPQAFVNHSVDILDDRNMGTTKEIRETTAFEPVVSVSFDNNPRVVQNDDAILGKYDIKPMEKKAKPAVEKKPIVTRALPERKKPGRKPGFKASTTKED